MKEIMSQVAEIKEMIERSTAKKPIKLYFRHFAKEMDCCPNCKSMLPNTEYQKNDFCQFCGQKLDWSEGNEQR